MTDDTTTETATPTESRLDVALRYRGNSQVLAEGGRSTVALCGNTYRTPVAARGRILDPIRMREHLAALHDIVGSDFRYKPKDRTAYLAYQRLKKQSASLGAWQQQQQYYEWLERNDPDAWTALDPVVTAHRDELFFEVFSRDEGTWARLAVDWSALELDGEPTHGTTNIEFGDGLADGLQRMRSYKDAWLQLGPDAATLDTDESETPEITHSLRLPHSWMRGVLQVQSAATLPRSSFSMAPIDLYNLLRWLRMHADVKRERRAMRIELVPGEPVRIVLEPWEDEVFVCDGPVYAGSTPQVVRLWGRRRLILARRLLPFVESVDVHVLGSGLPSFWVLRAGGYTMTLGLAGFTASNWSRAVSFDLLLPRTSVVTPALESVLETLAEMQFATQAELADATGLETAAVFEVLQQGALQGKVSYDLDRDVFRIRPMTDAPLDPVKLEFRNDRERQAHDLVADGAVKILEENRIVGVGVEIVGKVATAADQREHRASMLIGDDGRVLKAEDTSDHFRKHGLKEGPSVPLIALRLAWALEEARRAAERSERRDHVAVETRTYTRRDDRGEDIVQVALDRTKLKIRWGRRGQRQRLQQLRFNDVADARDAYFARVERLERDGYLDASAAG